MAGEDECVFTVKEWDRGRNMDKVKLEEKKRRTSGEQLPLWK